MITKCIADSEPLAADTAERVFPAGRTAFEAAVAAAFVQGEASVAIPT